MLISRTSLFACGCAVQLATASFAWGGEFSYLRANDEILTIGDSVTAQGFYQAYMQQVLDTLYPGAGIKLVNVGIGGMRSDYGSQALRGYTEKGKPTLVTVMFGVNDTGWRPTDQEEKEKQYVANITAVLDPEQARIVHLAPCTLYFAPFLNVP